MKRSVAPIVPHEQSGHFRRRVQERAGKCASRTGGANGPSRRHFLLWSLGSSRGQGRVLGTRNGLPTQPSRRESAE